MAQPEEAHAAPPDAAGHRGAETAPRDVLNQDARAGEDGPQPELQQNPPPQAGGFQGTPLVLWVVLALLLAVGVMMVVR